MIKVIGLLEWLQTLPKDAVIILAKDAEGNDYSPLDGIEFGEYTADTTWSGEFHSEDELGDEPHSPAICLWPVN